MAQAWVLAENVILIPVNLLIQGPRNLVGRVGAMTNIKTWMESRPADGKMQPGYKIYFQNAYKCIKDMEWNHVSLGQNKHLPIFVIKE